MNLKQKCFQKKLVRFDKKKHAIVRMLIEVFTFGNNCQCFNDLIGISTISAVMMLLSC